MLGAPVSLVSTKPPAALVKSSHPTLVLMRVSQICGVKAIEGIEFLGKRDDFWNQIDTL